MNLCKTGGRPYKETKAMKLIRNIVATRSLKVSQAMQQAENCRINVASISNAISKLRLMNEVGVTDGWLHKKQ